MIAVSVISSLSWPAGRRVSATAGRDGLGKLAFEQRARRHAHRDLQLTALRAPLGGLTQGLLEHMVGERLDDPRVLGQLDKGARLQQAEPRMFPADQRLDGDDGAPLQVEHQPSCRQPGAIPGRGPR